MASLAAFSTFFETRFADQQIQSWDHHSWPMTKLSLAASITAAVTASSYSRMPGIRDQLGSTPDGFPSARICMDVQMPEMDGFEATRHIREAERAIGRHTPIAAMTAHSMVGDSERCSAAGMDYYISKPLVKAELSALVDRVSLASAPGLTFGLLGPTDQTFQASQDQHEWFSKDSD